MGTKFTDVIRKRKLNTPAKIKEYLTGKVLTILNNANGHNYGNTGDSFKIDENARVGIRSMERGIPGGNTIEYSQFSVPDMVTENDLVEELNNLTEQKDNLVEEIDSMNNKLSYIRESNSDIFNEEEYKTFNIIKLIENSELTSDERIKKLTELIIKKA